jgi:Recombination endonuclease VII
MGDMTKATGVGRGATSCPAGCTCAKHGKSRVIDWDDPEAVRAYKRQQAAEKYEADPGPGKEAARRWRERNPGYRATRKTVLGSMSAADLKWMYGLTPDRVADLAVEQDNACYLCGEPLDWDNPRKIHVDHDHSCCRGRRSCGTCVRGLACHPCNTAIGLLGDDPERMRRVADNLEMAHRRLRETRPIRANQAGSNAPAGEES